LEGLTLFDEAELERWFKQAEQTLEAAEHDVAGGFVEILCSVGERGSCRAENLEGCAPA